MSAMETLHAVVRHERYGACDFTARQLAVLDMVGRASTPPRLSEISDALRMPRPSACRAIFKLSVLGLVVSRRGAQDRRLAEPVLTEAGRELARLLEGGA